MSDALPTREEIAYQFKSVAFGQPQMGVDWANPSNLRWLDAADALLALLRPAWDQAGAYDRETLRQATINVMDLTDAGLRERAMKCLHGEIATSVPACGPCTNCTRVFATFLALRDAARVEQREADAMAICERCRTASHLPSFECTVHSPDWCHESGVTGWGHYVCSAAAIRAQGGGKA